MMVRLVLWLFSILSFNLLAFGQVAVTVVSFDHVFTSSRISSGQYAGLGLAGNSILLGGFHTPADGTDRFFLGKAKLPVSSPGYSSDKFCTSCNASFSLLEGNSNPGRVTDFKTGKDGYSWATGFSDGALQVNGLSEEERTAGFFLVKMDGSGKALFNLAGTDRPLRNAAGALLEPRENGGVLLAGRFTGKLTLGGHSINAPVDQEISFIALLDANGSCQLLLPWDARVSTLLEDKQGRIWIGGAYDESIMLLGRELSTSGNFDSDGYIAVVNGLGQLEHVQTFGEPGVIRPGFRTQDEVVGIAELNEGVAVISSREVPLEESGSSRVQLWLTMLDSRFHVQEDKQLALDLIPRGPVAVTADDQRLYFSYAVQGLMGTVTVKLGCVDSEGGILQHLGDLTLSEGAARELLVRDGALYVAGHYREAASFNYSTVSFEGNQHGFFLLALSLSD